MNEIKTSDEKAAKVDLQKKAVEYGDRGCSCSEAILSAYGESLGLDRDLAVKIASGFGGGMGLRGDACGAATAAFMVLGLKFGTADLTDGYTRQKTYLLVDEFAEEFIAAQGSLYCRDLCLAPDSSGSKTFKDLRASNRPREIIRDAARILEKMFVKEKVES